MFDRNQQQYLVLIDKQHGYRETIRGIGKEDGVFEPKIADAKARVEAMFRSIAAEGDWRPTTSERS